MTTQVQASENALANFWDGIHNAGTRTAYNRRLNWFLEGSLDRFDYDKHKPPRGKREQKLDIKDLERLADSFISQARSDNQFAQAAVVNWIRYQKGRVEEHEIDEVTVRSYYKPVPLFYSQNDILSINWKRITHNLPHGTPIQRDRAPTSDELRQLLTYQSTDRRIKLIVTFMASSGIRLGAWDYLRVGDLEPIRKDGKIVAAKLLVYRGQNKGKAKQYTTFISSEAYGAFEEYRKYRESFHEVITPDSPVVRNLFPPDSYRAHPSEVVPLRSFRVKRLVENALRATDLRHRQDGSKRYDFQANHGFRKFFETTLLNHGVSPLHTAVLTNHHDTGLMNNYYRPTEEDLKAIYLKVESELLISNEWRAKVKDEAKEALEREKTLEKLDSLTEKYDSLQRTVQNLSGIIQGYADRDSRYSVEQLKAQDEFAEEQLRKEDQESRREDQSWKDEYLKKNPPKGPRQQLSKGRKSADRKLSAVHS